MHYILFCIWLISLNSVSEIHPVQVWIIGSLFFIAVYECSIAWIYQNSFTILLLIDFWCQFFTIMNEAARNILIYAL